MPFHQYSRLFTSGLLSEPSPPPTVDTTPPQRRRRSLFLNPTGSESTKPADLRPCSFLELADSLTSPTSPTDPSSPWRPLGHRPVSVAGSPTAVLKSGSVRLRRTVLAPTSLNAAVSSPTDSFLHLPTVSYAAGQSFLVTDPPLPDSPTLARGPSLRTIASRSASSASLSIRSETKRMNRLTALACLEGRGHFSTRTPIKNHSNFMSMSDDEDEDYPITHSRRPSADKEASRRLSTMTASNIPSGGEGIESTPSDPVPPSPQQSKMASVRSRHRSRTMESWFPPLANFIDLRNEEDPPKWRSFIEFSPATA